MIRLAKALARTVGGLLIAWADDGRSPRTIHAVVFDPQDPQLLAAITQAARRRR